jgi:hypothetical protein
MSVTRRDVGSPDDSMAFDHGSVEVVRVGTSTIRRSTFEPGWRWTTNVGPIAKTDSCQVHHVGYLVSGTLRVAPNDGGETEINAGDAFEILPGHDGWVVGDETVRTIEFAVEG